MGTSYKDLLTWQKAMRLVVAIYEATRQFPREEIYGLTSQLRRAAVSVPSNIAEGAGRFSDREFKQFLSQARGSLLEIETQVLISRELQYVSAADAEKLLQSTEELSRMLSGLRDSIRPRSAGDALTAAKSAQPRVPTRNSQLTTHNS